VTPDSTSPTAPSRRRARPEGEAGPIVFRRRLRHPPERVWRALTEPDELRTWFLTEATIDGRPGGTVDLVTGPDRVHATGRILEWEPPRVYEHEWRVPPGPYVPNGESAVVRWELTPVEEGTLLVLTWRGLSRATAQTFSRGLRGFVDRLEGCLDGTSLPQWPPPARTAT
jgi:uncharacterized protein YndB with AHSA1/START domain